MTVATVDRQYPDPDEYPDRRGDIDDVEVDAVDPDATRVDGQLVLRPDDSPEPWERVPGRTALERFAARPLPTLISIKVTSKWWAWHLTRALLNLVVHSPQLFLYQIPHVFRGIGIWLTTYAAWRAQPDWMGAAKIAEPKDRAKEIARVRRRQIAHTRMTWIAMLGAVAAAVWALRNDYGSGVIAALILITAWADFVGRKGAPVSAPTVEIIPRSNFQAGAPTRAVVNDVHATLVDMGYDPERLSVVEPRVGEHGISMVIHTPQEIDEKVVEAIERGLQTYRGAAHLVGDPDNAALHELRVYWTDPLATSITPPRLAPNSMSIATPAVIGYGIGGVPLELPLMRTNVGIVGAPGSGKSSTLWTIIDYLSVCRDVELVGIDLSGGPALRSWGGVFADRADNRDEAKALLQREIAHSIERTNLLAERSEPRPGMPAPESENWTPRDAEAGRGLFRILVVDELPLLSNDKELVALFCEHQRIGRKAGCTSVWAAQDLSGETLGATSLRKYPSTLILHACSREDVTTALGGGKVKEGWAPHRFVAAEGDSANDAGKCFIKSGRHTRPVPWRVARLDSLPEIHERAFERMDAGRPTDAPPAETATVVPPLLAAVSAVFRAAGEPAFMPTADLLEALTEVGYTDFDPTKLGAALRAHDVTSARQRHNGSPTRGYRYSDIRGAIDGL